MRASLNLEKTSNFSHNIGHTLMINIQKYLHYVKAPNYTCCTLCFKYVEIKMFPVVALKHLPRTFCMPSERSRVTVWILRLAITWRRATVYWVIGWACNYLIIAKMENLCAVDIRCWLFLSSKNSPHNDVGQWQIHSIFYVFLDIISIEINKILRSPLVGRVSVCFQIE